MASLVIKILSIILGLLFLFIGSQKLTDAIDKDTHALLVTWARNHWWKFWGEELLGIKQNYGDQLRQAIGTAEILSGLFLLVPPFRIIGALNLVFIMVYFNF